MLLKNFYTSIFMPSLNAGDGIPVKYVNGANVVYYRPYPKTSGSSYVPQLVRALYDLNGFYGMKEPLSVGFEAGKAGIGTGTTPPKFDDYTFSGSEIRTISSLVTSTSKTVEEDGITISTTWTVTNTGAEAITIGEMVYWGGYNGSASSNNTSTTPMCIERTVLEEPLTIEAGGVGQLTYTIRLKYPTA